MVLENEKRCKEKHQTNNKDFSWNLCLFGVSLFFSIWSVSFVKNHLSASDLSDFT